MSDTFNIEELNNLSEQEKQIALQILKDLQEKGVSKQFDDLKYADYKEIPVDIETFLTDKRFLGSGLINPDGKFTVFPYWVKKLKEIFPTNLDTAYNTLVLTGGIGLGKSLIATICILYLLYRMLCLKDPYLHYGLQPIDKITFSLLNITIDAAKGVAWDKMQSLLQSSPWFMDHGQVSGRSEIVWEPPKGIELVIGSSNSAIIGRAVFANFTDEVNFAAITTNVEKIKAKQRTLISQVDARMQSRFMKSNKLPTLQIIASSKNSEQSFLESYIQMKKENESKTTLIVDEPQWVIRDDKHSDTNFYVAVGNKFLASEVLPLDYTEELLDDYRNRGYELLKVPSGYYEAFKDDVEIALTDIAGISTISALKYISGAKLAEIKDVNYKNPFTRDIIITGTDDKETQYKDFFDLSLVNPDDKHKPMFIHLDMSKSGDKTGIAGVIAEKIRINSEDAGREIQYKVIFSVSIQAPRGHEISFEKNRSFIRWLKSQSFNIRGVSSDTYQSAQIQQQLNADGFNASIISVDRLESSPGTKQKVCLPYQNFRSALYEKRIKLYNKCDLLTDEILGLEKEPDGHINHPDNGASGSKDQIDAVVGAMYNATLHIEELAYNYGESLVNILDINRDAANFQEQIRQELEDQMKQQFNPIKKQGQDSSENYLDFGMGKAQSLPQQYLSQGIVIF